MNIIAIHSDSGRYQRHAEKVTSKHQAYQAVEDIMYKCKVTLDADTIGEIGDELLRTGHSEFADSWTFSIELDD